MLPEKVWDAAPIPECFVTLGRPTGAALPPVWIHSELDIDTPRLYVGRQIDSRFRFESGGQ